MKISNWMETNLWHLNPMQRSIGKRGKLGTGEVASPMKDHTIGCPLQTDSPENTHVDSTIRNEQTCACVYVCVHNNN